ncbi:MAG TPA: esterase, partial [Phycicoccus sp.]|nr:esterase [Phycicoccus sp.]
MERRSVRLGVPGHEADLEVVRHGHWGRPVLLFPSENGSATDAEGNGMLAAVADLVDAGRMSLFCVD